MRSIQKNANLSNLYYFTILKTDLKLTFHLVKGQKKTKYWSFINKKNRSIKLKFQKIFLRNYLRKLYLIYVLPQTLYLKTKFNQVKIENRNLERKF